MNRIFKSLWNDARQQYIVTNEKQASRGKRTKSALIAAVALAVASGAAFASSYHEPGRIGNQSSWETAEYQKDWGLTAMHASKAYSLGFNGAHTTVGVMDSGALLQKHPELAGSRFVAVHAEGTYSYTGNHYQKSVEGIGDDFGNGDYTAGDYFSIDGNFIAYTNDSHGTHVTGTVGANRDGSEFHGVAWGSKIAVGNTGATDNNNYGPFQDYNFYYQGWSAIADLLVADNGTLENGESRGGVINNSFGTNLRYTTSDGTTTSYPVNDTKSSEYEYFLFKKVYGDNPSFVDAAWDAIKGKNVVQIFTTGNRRMNNPYYRPNYPYFNPEAENQWIAVAGLMQVSGEDGKYKVIESFNKAGDAKWWTVVAPGAYIYSSTVYEDHYVPSDAEHPVGTPGYETWSGTSMAAPHVAGAMGVLMSRYPSMTAMQVRDVMFTTANHKNEDGTNFENWTAAKGVPDVKYGWGVPDLDKGMYGPGQFLGHFDYALGKGRLDVWSNDISQVALDAREIEDREWMEKTENGTRPSGDYELGEDFTVPDIEDSVITEAEAEEWQLEYYAKRAANIQNKIDNGLYDGKLIKEGGGKLVMTGNNTYRGGTEVKEGTLIGFNDSFGVTEDGGNGQVTVAKEGAFGVVNKYRDRLTLKGMIRDKSNDHSVDVTMASGSTLVVAAGQDNTIGSLTLGNKLTLKVDADAADLARAYVRHRPLVGTLTADSITVNDEETSTQAASAPSVMLTGAGTPTLTGASGTETTTASSDYALFSTNASISGNTVTATMSGSGTTLEDYAANSQQRVIATAIGSDENNSVLQSLVTTADGSDVSSLLQSLDNDFFINNRNAVVLNEMTLMRAVRDQAAGIGSGRMVEMADGHGRLWASGIGSWSSVDVGQFDTDSDFYAALIGGEVDATDSTKIGAFFGAGTTKNTAGSNKWDSNDVHVGLYGLSNIKDVAAVQYGVSYTKSDADSQRFIGDTFTTHTGDTDAVQVYVEGAWKGFNTEKYAVEPYLGIAWMHIESDDFTETFAQGSMKTRVDDQDVGVGTLGVRGSLPFTIGSVGFSLKADAAWNHFFGDNRAEGELVFGSGVAVMKAGKIDDLGSLSLGLEAKLGKSATFGLSYVGAYGDDVTSSGVNATLRVLF
jgi:subtilase-type serine protease